jgi:hypothetical protein
MATINILDSMNNNSNINIETSQSNEQLTIAAINTGGNCGTVTKVEAIAKLFENKETHALFISEADIPEDKFTIYFQMFQKFELKIVGRSQAVLSDKKLIIKCIWLTKNNIPTTEQITNGTQSDFHCSVEIQTNEKKILCIGIYGTSFRSHKNEFWQKMNQFNLSKHKNKNTILIGDFNLDLQREEESEIVHNYLSDYDYIDTGAEYTWRRIAQEKILLSHIDQIFVSKSLSQLVQSADSSELDPNLSPDHVLIKVTLLTNIEKTETTPKNRINKKKLIELLQDNTFLEKMELEILDKIKNRNKLTIAAQLQKSIAEFFIENCGFEQICKIKIKLPKETQELRRKIKMLTKINNHARKNNLSQWHEKLTKLKIIDNNLPQFSNYLVNNEDKITLKRYEIKLTRKYNKTKQKN